MTVAAPLERLNRLQQEVKRERAALQKLVERYRASADDEGLKGRSSPRSAPSEAP